MTSTAILTSEQREAAGRIDALDLDPIAFKLMHPEPGPAVISLAGADQRVTAYRCFLKLCAWYPAAPIVPSKLIDEVWHAHILDTAKYAADTTAVFGSFMHHFPYFGLRGAGDETAWHAAYARTTELFRAHFGAELAGQAARGCHVGGSSCKDGSGGICTEGDCERTAGPAASTRERPRPDRTAVPLSPNLA